MNADSAPREMAEMPWIRWLDLDTTVESDGTLVVMLARPKPEHINHNGAINGAVVYGVAEVAGLGAAVLGMLDLLPRMYAVVEAAKIAYGAPATEGLVATSRVDASMATASRATVERGEAAQLDTEVALADLSGRATGTCTFTIALRPRRTSSIESERDDG
jgi:acyl-coenzyme A thioesterase PaaI-like protein